MENRLLYWTYWNRQKAISLILCMFFLQIADSQTKDREWTLKKFENDVVVYTRTAENSNYKELKAETTIKTSLSSIVAVLNDWEKYPLWVYRCGKSTTLKKISEKEVIHYQTVVAPWPVDSRDFIVNVKLEQNEKTKQIIITSTCMSDYLPKLPDHVRITEFKATWILTPQKDGTVKLVYQLLVNPGGYVPAWLVNLAVVDGPFITTSNLRDRVLTENYQKTKIPYISEPE